MGGEISTIVVGVATAAIGALLGWFGKELLRWLRSDSAWEREEVRELRKALDRAMRRELRNSRRENALATGFEIVLLVIPPELTHSQREAVERARQLCETALLHPHGGE